MTFKKQYQNAATVSPIPSSTFPIHAFAGTFYDLLEDTADCFLTILSGGGVELSSCYKLTIQPLDCHMLLYTREGCGILRIHNTAYSLEPGTLLYLNCHISSYIMEASHAPWRFVIFMIQGSFLMHIESLFPFHEVLLHPVLPYSSILKGIEQLLAGSPAASFRNKLKDASILQSIVTDLFLEAFCPEKTDDKHASYLSEIRQYLDMYFAEPFRLEDLESRYHMNKYRICREFSKAYAAPPLKYLNQRRLEAATNLLLTTDKRVHEISLEVGFESTNHFINLFKRSLGMTPQAYRDANRS